MLLIEKVLFDNKVILVTLNNGKENPLYKDPAQLLSTTSNSGARIDCTLEKIGASKYRLILFGNSSCIPSDISKLVVNAPEKNKMSSIYDDPIMYLRIITTAKDFNKHLSYLQKYFSSQIEILRIVDISLPHTSSTDKVALTLQLGNLLVGKPVSKFLASAKKSSMPPYTLYGEKDYFKEYFNFPEEKLQVNTEIPYAGAKQFLVITKGPWKKYKSILSAFKNCLYSSVSSKYTNPVLVKNICNLIHSRYGYNAEVFEVCRLTKSKEHTAKIKAFLRNEYGIYDRSPNYKRILTMPNSVKNFVTTYADPLSNKVSIKDILSPKPNTLVVEGSFSEVILDTQKVIKLSEGFAYASSMECIGVSFEDGKHNWKFKSYIYFVSNDIDVESLCSNFL